MDMTNMDETQYMEYDDVKSEKRKSSTVPTSLYVAGKMVS